jgi:hypothetical protein
MKQPYEKPTIVSESVFETLAAGCGLFDPDDDTCSPYLGGTTAS